jgi:hypothetical protein
MSYHPVKANMVAEVLSRKSLHMSAHITREMDLNEQFKDLSLVCEIMPSSVKLSMLKLTSHILEEIREGRNVDLKLMDRLVIINKSKVVDFRVGGNKIMKSRD